MKIKVKSSNNIALITQQTDFTIQTVAIQIKEMNKFQQNIYELERSQQKLKKQYVLSCLSA